MLNTHSGHYQLLAYSEATWLLDIVMSASLVAPTNVLDAQALFFRSSFDLKASIHLEFFQVAVNT